MTQGTIPENFANAVLDYVVLNCWKANIHGAVALAWHCGNNNVNCQARLIGALASELAGQLLLSGPVGINYFGAAMGTVGYMLRTDVLPLTHTPGNGMLVGEHVIAAGKIMYHKGWALYLALASDALTLKTPQDFVDEAMRLAESLII